MFHISCCMKEKIQLGLLLLFLILVILCLIVKFTTKPFPNILCFEQEKYFKTSKEGTKVEEFPSLDSPGSVQLSVIVPAYNEELRLPKMLNECLEFLEKKKFIL